MNIVMLCLTGLYMPGWGYQENFLARQALRDGHRVTIVANCFQLNPSNSKLVRVAEGTSFAEGCKVIRLKMRNFGPLTNKFRRFPELYDILEQEKPDILFVHGVQFGEIRSVFRYLSKHKECYAVCDSHADADNSGLNFLSKYLLHRIYYKTKVKNIEKYFQRIYYVALEPKRFLEQNYNIHHNLEKLFLGGYCLTDNEYIRKREQMRQQFSLSDSDIMCIHCGKMNQEKKTLEILESFQQVSQTDNRYKLYLIGSFSKDIESIVKQYLNKNTNIVEVGWKNSEEMNDYFAASDLVIQIGSASTVFQQAICCRAILILNGRENNRYLLRNNNGFIANNKQELTAILRYVSNDTQILQEMHDRANQLAMQDLDYGMQMQKIYSDYTRYKNETKGETA